MSEDPLVVLLILVEAGYGSLREVKEMDVREVLQAVHFRNFKNDYEAAYLELGRK